jgi:hypothetical protein
MAHHFLASTIMPPAKPTPTSSSAALKIAKNSQGHTLSKGQKQFNQLTKKIASLRQQVKQWEDLLPVYQQQYQGKFQPLMAEFNQQRQAMLRLFDAAYQQKKLNKTERKHLRAMIEDILDELLEYDPNEELKALFTQYHGLDYDKHEQSMQEDLQAMMREVMGVEIDQPIDYRDPEAVLKMLHEQASAQAAKEQAEAEAAEANPAAKPGKAAKPSKKELKRQAEQALAEQQIGQTLREVYRKLASALHPDRETDEAERTRKTALMSRVNVAYDNKDLLRLLELQLEVEQIDASMINSFSAERLKHFNQILSEQVAELQMELVQIHTVFQLRFPALQPDPDRAIPPASRQLPLLMQEVAQLEAALAGLNHDLVSLADVQHLKQWLTELAAAERLREQEEARARRDFERLFGKGPGRGKGFMRDQDDWPF